MSAMQGASPEPSTLAPARSESNVARELMRFHATQFERSTWIVIAAMVGLLYTLHERALQPEVLAWAGMTMVVALWRHGLSRAMRKDVASASAAQLRRYEILVLISTALSSTAVGASFWLIGLQGDLYVKLIVTMFSMIHVLAMLVYTAPDTSHRVVRTIGNVGQGLLFWLGVGSDEPPRWDVIAAYCGVAWLGMTFGREHIRQFRDSLRIRDENAALLAQLESDKRFIEVALKEAKLANDSKSRFLAAASHDLRQPLHALTMFLGTMTFHVTTDEAKRLLARIKDTVQVLEEQFNSLLDLSKFDVGAVVADLKPFRLDNSIERLVDEFRTVAAAKRLDVTAAVCPAVVKSDPLLLARLLRNLLDNAVKYTSSGSVAVRVTAQPGAFQVEIEDTGPGIPEEQQMRIFDEYVQLANPARQRRHGVGLGLAIVKRIDQLLGLGLTIRSTVDVGTCFSFAVPAAAGDDCQARATLAPEGSSAASFRTSASIWILDDDPIALDSLQAQLDAWGAHVTVFSRPEALLERLSSGASLPHWIFTDDMLGESLSGLDTARTLSRQFGFGRVCLVTGNTEPRRLTELRSSGFPVIVKPAKPEQLIAVIAS